MKFNFYLMSTIAIATIATACTAEMKQNQLTPEEKQKDGSFFSTVPPLTDGVITTATASQPLGLQKMG